ncbi:MAG: YaaR family protein [Treponema sp.]|nr:YaaR family protein [Treponema sp.]
MARVDGDVPSLFMNPSVYSQVKKEEQKKTRGIGNSGKTEFSRLFEELRGKTAGELGPLLNLPPSEEAINFLMDEVRSTGDTLRSRPFPDEILRYKQAVRNFMHYVVEHCYNLSHETGIPKFIKPGYKGPRGTPEAMKQITYTKIEVIDKKLEDLAAMLLSSQMPQLEIASRLEEIKGLLIDLLQ